MYIVLRPSSVRRGVPLVLGLNTLFLIAAIGAPRGGNNFEIRFRCHAHTHENDAHTAFSLNDGDWRGA